MVGWLRRLCGGLVAEAMWWVAGEIGNKAISASNLVEVEVEVEAELGNKTATQNSKCVEINSNFFRNLFSHNQKTVR